MRESDWLLAPSSWSGKQIDSIVAVCSPANTAMRGGCIRRLAVCVCSVIDHRLRQNVVRRKSCTRAAGECVTDVLTHEVVVENRIDNYEFNLLNMLVELFYMQKTEPG